MMPRALALALAVALGACETPFEPIQESTLYFSLAGYLDASVDTQWVRIEEVAPTIDPNPDLLDVTVRLTAEGRPLEAEWTQVVRAFNTGPAHLFWTTEDIEPNVTYRLTVEGAGGEQTTATAEVPDDNSFSVQVETGRFVCPAKVTVSGAQRVADVQARYLVAEGGGLREYRFTHLRTSQTLEDGSFQALIYFADDASRMNVNPITAEGVVSAEIVVGVATDAWPDVRGLTLEDLLGLEVPTVENGVGFIGGVVTERYGFVPNVITSGFGNALPCTSNP